MLGPGRSTYNECLARYAEPGLEQSGWEAAAVKAGLRPVSLAYAGDTAISAGRSCFAGLDPVFAGRVWRETGQPGGNAAVWQERIMS
ncbi:MAG: hypothetical protein HS126_35280 [Anaerolineales bacterium]|nr:hypothetical protein [Anaerolineales bacterium]